MPRLLLLTVAILVPSLLPAQDKSVNPGINKSFENPDVEQFTHSDMLPVSSRYRGGCPSSLRSRNQ